MIELISIFANNIAPVLIVAGIGFAAGRRYQLETRTLGILIFNVLTPMLVFHSLYVSEIAGSDFASMVGLVVLLQLIMTGISYGVMAVRGVNKIERASIMLNSVCPNVGNFGLSISAFAFGGDVLAWAVVILVSNTFLHYSLGVFIASSGRQSPRQALLMILRVPAVYATAAALILRGLNVELPPMVFQSVTMLKDASIPAMLLLLGLQLSQSMAVHRWRLVSAGVVLKMLIAPAVALGIVLVFQLENAAAIAFILQASMPAAVTILILAQAYELDETLTLNLIVATTLISPFTLSVIILLLKPLALS